MILPWDNIEREKAFDLAVRVPAFRKTRLEELRKEIRSHSFSVFVAVLFVFASYFSFHQSPNARLIIPASQLMIAFLFLGRAMTRYSEAKVLKMLDIQEALNASRAAEKHG